MQLQGRMDRRLRARYQVPRGVAHLQLGSTAPAGTVGRLYFIGISGWLSVLRL